MSSSTLLETPAAAAPLLDLNPEAFQAHFPHEPFLVRHRLGDHPRFALTELVELAKRLPEKHIEYNAGNLAVNADPDQTPRNGLSVEETIRRIEECNSWMVLKYVERDPKYAELLHHCLDEVRVHSEANAPGMCQAEGFIFISSPGSVTPYHMDPEHNFLLQVRGLKTVHLFDPNDRALLSEQELERFYRGAHRNMVFKDEYQQKARTFHLSPGDGVHFPVTAPHWVQNGPEVSVSFSITFRTRALEKRSAVYVFNDGLRRRGLTPAPFGRCPWRDALKYNLYRAWLRARKLFGNGPE
jgi:ribosomal protein L16 Arg81 hydroxylase